jgi:hypothetical protein
MLVKRALLGGYSGIITHPTPPAPGLTLSLREAWQELSAEADDVRAWVAPDDGDESIDDIGEGGSGAYCPLCGSESGCDCEEPEGDATGNDVPWQNPIPAAYTTPFVQVW